MKGKIVSAVIMIVVFVCLSVAPAKAQTPVPSVDVWAFASHIYHSVLHAINAPIDVAEVVSGEIAVGVAKADAWVDAANGETPAALSRRAAKRQAKAAKRAAKRAAKQTHQESRS